MISLRSQLVFIVRSAYCSYFKTTSQFYSCRARFHGIIHLTVTACIFKRSDWGPFIYNAIPLLRQLYNSSLCIFFIRNKVHYFYPLLTRFHYDWFNFHFSFSFPSSWEQKGLQHLQTNGTPHYIFYFITCQFPKAVINISTSNTFNTSKKKSLYIFFGGWVDVGCVTCNKEFYELQIDISQVTRIQNMH